MEVRVVCNECNYSGKVEVGCRNCTCVKCPSCSSEDVYTVEDKKD